MGSKKCICWISNQLRVLTCFVRLYWVYVYYTICYHVYCCKHNFFLRQSIIFRLFLILCIDFQGWCSVSALTTWRSESRWWLKVKDIAFVTISIHKNQRSHFFMQCYTTPQKPFKYFFLIFMHPKTLKQSDASSFLSYFTRRHNPKKLIDVYHYPCTCTQLQINSECTRCIIIAIMRILLTVLSCVIYFYIVNCNNINSRCLLFPYCFRCNWLFDISRWQKQNCLIIIKYILHLVT